MLACLLAETFIGRGAASRYNTTSAPLPGVVNVHLFPHSHDDAGWLKSAQEYFDGAQVIGIEPWPELSLYYANGAVQYILTSVMDALASNSDRKFVVVEQWFFQRWFNAQTEDSQARVRALVASGQLSFANGGLVMHDEATASYIDMLDQTAAGIRWLARTFGASALPRVTSQLDPFGHSAAQASLFASPLSGYIAQYHARMDYQEVNMRRATATMDFAWAPSASLGLSATTMGSLGFYGYSTPDGFCFDVSIECQAEGAAIYSPTGLNNPINDDTQRGAPDAVGDNVLAYMAQVLSTVAGQRASYPADADGTVHLPWTMGDDFFYSAAHFNYGSMDKLIHYTNLNTSVHGINMLYSSQAEYAAARLGMTVPLALKTSDAMPYADSPHLVWSGYFTSRPALKGFVRETSALFSAARQLQAWVSPPSDVEMGNPLWLLEQGLGLAQHHDAVSGTSKQAVAYDYARRLQAGRDAAGAAISGWLNDLLGLNASSAPPAGWATCDLANATLCALTELTAAATAVVLQNAQSVARAGVPVRIPVPLGGAAASWRVLDADGIAQLPAQLVPASPADADLRVGYYGAPPANMSWLVFLAPRVPAAGWAVVFLVPVSSTAEAPHTHASVITTVRSGAPAVLSNGIIKLSFDGASGLLSGYASTSPESLASVALSQNLFVYASNTGDAVSGAKSGACA